MVKLFSVILILFDVVATVIFIRRTSVLWIKIAIAALGLGALFAIPTIAMELNILFQELLLPVIILIGIVFAVRSAFRSARHH